MLPEAYHLPAEGGELFRLATITRDILLDLLRPPSGVGPRHLEVQRTAVPEAAVREDADLGRSEHQVRFAPHGWHGAGVLAAAQPSGAKPLA